MPRTAKKHFDEDIKRVEAIVAHAYTLPHRRAAKALLRDDLFRAAWMHAVGAMDAYFCDAYADMLARVLRAKNLQPNLRLTKAIEKIDLPVGAIFAPTNVRKNWRWRLAARSLIEKDNILSLSKVQQLFNPFLRTGYKLFEAEVLNNWILNHRAAQRLVGINRTSFNRLTGPALENARKTARTKIVKRYDQISQRRHDCIHNCDRPKQSVQNISYTATQKAIIDVKFLVSNCNSHFEAEFNHYLTTVGADAQTRNTVGY